MSAGNHQIWRSANHCTRLSGGERLCLIQPQICSSSLVFMMSSPLGYTVIRTHAFSTWPSSAGHGPIPHFTGPKSPVAPTTALQLSFSRTFGCRGWTMIYVSNAAVAIGNVWQAVSIWAFSGNYLMSLWDSVMQSTYFVRHMVVHNECSLRAFLFLCDQ